VTLKHKTKRSEAETPSQERIIKRIEQLTTGHRSQDWVTSGEIGEPFIQRGGYYRKLEQIRDIVDNVEARHSTQVDGYDHDGRPAWLYTYRETDDGGVS